MLKEANFSGKEQGHYNFAKNVFSLAGGTDALEGETIKKTNENFEKATRELCGKLTVSGVLQYDKEKGEQVLRPFSDLDGESSIAIFKLAGIKVNDVNYVKPGDYKEASINLDTGDKFGVEYDAETSTLFLDHHAKGQTEKTSTAAIAYETLDKLGMFRDAYKNDKELKPALKKLVDFVTKIDNRQYAPEEFLKSAKTVLGLQRDLSFDKLLEYFKDHDLPTEELEPEDFEKYGLEEASLKQQAIVDKAMNKLEEMEADGKFFNSKYGKILVNENNELPVGASAAYTKFDGIINISPGKSFAYTLKEGKFDEIHLRRACSQIAKEWQGKIIRGQMWIYNDKDPLNLTVEDLKKLTESAGFQGKLNGKEINYYKSLTEVPEYCEACDLIGGYCGNCAAAGQFVKKSDKIEDENGAIVTGYFYDPNNIL